MLTASTWVQQHPWCTWAYDFPTMRGASQSVSFNQGPLKARCVYKQGCAPKVAGSPGGTLRELMRARLLRVMSL